MYIADVTISSGPFISFHALVLLNTRVRSLPLTAALPLNDRGLFSGRQQLYAAFRAARDLLNCTEEDAERMTASSLPKIPSSRTAFPNVESLLRVDGKNDKIYFDITDHLGEDPPNRFVYLAMTRAPGAKRILIKFPQQYGKELHSFCAANEFAPESFAFERLIGGWYGIAMEFVPNAMSLADADPKCIRERGDSWLERMDKIVDAFHEAGFVHGDLRPPNFIVDSDRMLLVDFDWGGRDGEAIIPDMELHPVLRRGRNVKLITVQHDNDTLNYTKGAIRTVMNDGDVSKYTQEWFDKAVRMATSIWLQILFPPS